MYTHTIFLLGLSFKGDRYINGDYYKLIGSVMQLDTMKVSGDRQNYILLSQHLMKVRLASIILDYLLL